MKKYTRTKFPSTVKSVTDTVTLLKPASNNTKLGNGKTIITKGKLKGMPLYSLTLEERVTCPKECHFYDSLCYGGSMPWATRYKYGRKLTTKLTQELRALSKKHKKGFLIRLHILGDFYSTGYVKYWSRQLERYSNLHVFGFTARVKGEIHEELLQIRKKYGDRWVMRFSSNKAYSKKKNLNIYAVKEDFNGDYFQCPEQLGKVDSCIQCGLCFTNQVTKSVKFLTH